MFDLNPGNESQIKTLVRLFKSEPYLTTSQIAKVRAYGFWGPRITSVGTACSKARRELAKEGLKLVCDKRVVKDKKLKMGFRTEYVYFIERK